jgi:hypothetical protein
VGGEKLFARSIGQCALAGDSTRGDTPNTPAASAMPLTFPLEQLPVPNVAGIRYGAERVDRPEK